jgi:hypothetical protein
MYNVNTEYAEYPRNLNLVQKEKVKRMAELHKAWNWKTYSKDIVANFTVICSSLCSMARIWIMEGIFWVF